MNLINRINSFKQRDSASRLDSWQELLSIGHDFIKSESKNAELAKNLARTIYNHSSLLCSSIDYEGSTEIDIDLREVSHIIARLVYDSTKKLKDYLDAALYYSNFIPNRFNKEGLEKELSQLSN